MSFDKLKNECVENSPILWEIIKTNKKSENQIYVSFKIIESTYHHHLFINLWLINMLEAYSINVGLQKRIFLFLFNPAYVTQCQQQQQKN